MNIFIQNIQRSSLMSIGKGIVGSANETKSRRRVEWGQQDSAHFLRQNGGKALGWVHVKDDNTKEPICHAIMYSIKIPLNLVERTEEDNRETSDWVRDVVSICMNSLSEKNDSTESKDGSTMQGSSVKLSEEDTAKLKKIIDDLEKVQSD